ncbi:CCA tRNA nucleotidyltransferase [Chloroflexota bacterium]
MIEVKKRNLKLLSEPIVQPPLATVAGFLTEHKIQSYLVGGFIRDVLLGRDTADIDIVVTEDALEIAPKAAAMLGGKYVLLDEVNGVGRVVLPGESISPAKRKWHLDFSTIKGDIETDLARRDFSIDAMAVDFIQLIKAKAEVQLIDPFSGRDDLQRGIVRAVSDTTFESDPARLLRAVRLAAELSFTIDSETEALIKRHHHLVAGVAGERIREELLRLLAVSKAEQILLYLEELGLLTALIPELAETKGVSQPREHFWDVFTHSIQAVASADFLLRHGDWQYAGEEVLAIVPWSSKLDKHFNLEVSSGSTRRLLLKLAALLHDIAKPQTKAVDETGRTRFLGHAIEGANVVANILERLRFSGKETKLVETMVRHHLRPTQMAQNELPSQRAIYRYFRDTGDAGIDILFLSLADHLATRGPRLNLTQWQEHAKIVEYVLTQRFEQKSLAVPPKLVDGHDLINIFGMNPGPKIGEIMETVHEAQSDGELTSREDALSYIRKYLLTMVES